jgi:hypothetical protein
MNIYNSCHLFFKQQRVVTCSRGKWLFVYVCGPWYFGTLVASEKAHTRRTNAKCKTVPFWLVDGRSSGTVLV